MREPAPNPDELLARLRRYQAAERELRAYVEGLFDALGIPRDRLAGIDDETGDLLLTEPPQEADA